MSLIPSEIKSDVDRILENIAYLYSETRRRTKAMAANYGLTGPQLTVAKVLESSSDISLSALSERIGAQNSTVTGIIDRMQREGLVVRARSSRDRRVVRIMLTDKGRALAGEIPRHPTEVLRSALDTLQPNECAELLRILAKLARHVRSLAAEPSLPAGGNRTTGAVLGIEPLGSDSEGK